MAKERQLPILRVVQIGSEEFARFVIKNEQERVWTGERFGSDGGVLYASYNDAASDSQDNGHWHTFWNHLTLAN